MSFQITEVSDLLIIGDSFAADYTKKYPDKKGWPNMLADVARRTSNIIKNTRNSFVPQRSEKAKTCPVGRPIKISRRYS